MSSSVWSDPSRLRLGLCVHKEVRPVRPCLPRCLVGVSRFVYLVKLLDLTKTGRDPVHWGTSVLVEIDGEGHLPLDPINGPSDPNI